MKLPQVPYSKSIMRPEVQTEFYGLNHNLSAKDGELYNTTNMTARHFPLLSTRDKRVYTSSILNPGGAAAQDYPVWISDGTLYVNKEQKTSTEGAFGPGDHQFAFMGDKIIIFPEKKIYNTADDTLENMYDHIAYPVVSFGNGSVYGIPAYANTITIIPPPQFNFNFEDHFKVGDAITITGCVTHPENNKDVIIREISRYMLTFDEYAFTLDDVWRWTPSNGIIPGGGCRFTINDVERGILFEGPSPVDYLEWDGTNLTGYYKGESGIIPLVTPESYYVELQFNPLAIVPYTENVSPALVDLAHNVPDLDFLCVNENRLWGCRGDLIYASKLGDPRNFNVFDGLDTDSWQSQTVDAGDFTACISYLGYPIFFKEHNVYKVYGDKPSNFQWTPSARFGVKAGCHKSLAVASETLFYVSPSGVCSYSGGLPSIISEALGVNKQWSNAVAGSDGIRYYISMSDGTDVSLFVYDTQYRTWHREDSAGVQDFVYFDNALYGLVWSNTPNLANFIYLSGIRPDIDIENENIEELSQTWEAEFADAYSYYKTTLTGSENKKGLLRLQIRCELDADATMKIYIMYDSSGTWEEVYSISSTIKKSFNVPLILKRCDHFRLKFTGETGSASGVRIYSITKVRYAGSNLQ